MALLGGREAFQSKQKTPHWLLVFVTFLIPTGLFYIALQPFRKSTGNQPAIFGGYGWLIFAVMIAVQISAVLWAYVRRSSKGGATQHVTRPEWIPGVLYVCITVPLLLWLTNQIWWPATPDRILHHVESFEMGRYPYLSWQDWEIPARWTIEQGLHPDLSRARAVLDNEIATDQDLLTFILGSAFRVGLVRPDQIDTLPDLEEERRSLLPEANPRKPRRIYGLNQNVWVFYALADSNQLSSEDRDFLEQRLLVTLENPVVKTSDMLETALRVTQLLEVIDRPIDREKYRKQVHQWLREFHSTQPHSFQIAGGFEKYQGVSASMLATSDAVELMQIYGIPEGLDLNWVRSYLRPLNFRPANRKWIAAVTLDRLNRLPGATQLTLFEWLYYERSLLAAMLLVVLCLYATLSSPLPPKDNSGTREDSALG